MSYRREFLKTILVMARGTIDHEIGCDACWEQVDRFAEKTLLGRDRAEAAPSVEAHLARCNECEEEFRALLASLEATSPRFLVRRRTFPERNGSKA